MARPDYLDSSAAGWYDSDNDTVVIARDLVIDRSTSDGWPTIKFQQSSVDVGFLTVDGSGSLKWSSSIDSADINSGTIDNTIIGGSVPAAGSFTYGTFDSATLTNITVSGNLYIGGTGAANALDDYEEGSWTPTLDFDGAAVGMTYSTQTGHYTKIGRFVQCYGVIILSAKGSSTGQVFIRGLPFNVASIFSGLNDYPGGQIGQIFGGTGVGFGGLPVLTITEGTDRITPKEITDGDFGHNNVYDTQVTDTFQIRFYVSYMA